MFNLPEPTPATVRPLHEMPEQQQRQIAELVAQPKPPPAPNNPANLQVTHSVCNLRKGAQYEEKVDR